MERQRVLGRSGADDSFERECDRDDDHRGAGDAADEPGGGGSGCE
jgi:hypothetical protein